MRCFYRVISQSRTLLWTFLWGGSGEDWYTVLASQYEWMVCCRLCFHVNVRVFVWLWITFPFSPFRPSQSLSVCRIFGTVVKYHCNSILITWECGRALCECVRANNKRVCVTQVHSNGSFRSIRQVWCSCLDCCCCSCACPSYVSLCLSPMHVCMHADCIAMLSFFFFNRNRVNNKLSYATLNWKTFVQRLLQILNALEIKAQTECKRASVWAEGRACWYWEHDEIVS